MLWYDFRQQVFTCHRFLASKHDPCRLRAIHLCGQTTASSDRRLIRGLLLRIIVEEVVVVRPKLLLDAKNTPEALFPWGCFGDDGLRLDLAGGCCAKDQRRPPRAEQLRDPRLGRRWVCRSAWPVCSSSFFCVCLCAVLLDLFFLRKISIRVLQ